MNTSSIPEESAMEEGVPVSPPEEMIPQAKNAADLRTNLKPRLSVISQKYDVDGDGVLDPAEKAMREMDTTNQGYLSNDTIYGMMKNHIEMQQQMFNMKRIIIGLVCFTFILALSNLGTAWAAVVIAKDTTVGDGNKLLNKNGNNVVGTKPVHSKYEVIVPTEAERRLATNQGTASLLSFGRSVASAMWDECPVDSQITLTSGGASKNLNFLCSNSGRVAYKANGNEANGGIQYLKTIYTFPVDGEAVVATFDCPATDRWDVGTATCDISWSPTTFDPFAPIVVSEPQPCPATEPRNGDTCYYEGEICGDYSTGTSLQCYVNNECTTQADTNSYQCSSSFIWEQQVVALGCAACPEPQETTTACPDTQPGNGDTCDSNVYPDTQECSYNEQFCDVNSICQSSYINHFSCNSSGTWEELAFAALYCAPCPKS